MLLGSLESTVEVAGGNVGPASAVAVSADELASVAAVVVDGTAVLLLEEPCSVAGTADSQSSAT